MVSGFILGLVAGLFYNTKAGKKLAGKVEKSAKDIVNAALTPKGESEDEQ